MKHFLTILWVMTTLMLGCTDKPELLLEPEPEPTTTSQYTLTDAYKDLHVVDDEDNWRVTRTRSVQNKTYLHTNGIWVDIEYEIGMKLTKIVFGSDTYFEHIEQKPVLLDYFKIGKHVIVCVDDICYELIR